MLIRRAFQTALLAVFALPLGAQDPDLLRSDSLWNTLRLRGDVAGLAPLLADDWCLTHSDGRVQDKQDYLTELATGRRTNGQVENIGVQLRWYGTVAVVTGISVQSGTNNGVPWSGRFRFTRTWILRDGSWVMVASHSSRCADGVACER